MRCTSVVAKREGPSSLVSHSWLTNSCSSDNPFKLREQLTRAADAIS